MLVGHAWHCSQSRSSYNNKTVFSFLSVSPESSFIIKLLRAVFRLVFYFWMRCLSCAFTVKLALDKIANSVSFFLALSDIISLSNFRPNQRKMETKMLSCLFCLSLQMSSSVYFFLLSNSFHLCICLFTILIHSRYLFWLLNFFLAFFFYWYFKYFNVLNILNNIVGIIW